MYKHRVWHIYSKKVNDDATATEETQIALFCHMHNRCETGSPFGVANRTPMHLQAQEAV